MSATREELGQVVRLDTGTAPSRRRHHRNVWCHGAVAGRRLTVYENLF